MLKNLKKMFEYHLEMSVFPNDYTICFAFFWVGQFDYIINSLWLCLTGMNFLYCTPRCNLLPH